MTQRQWLLGLVFLGGSVFFAPPAEAQRSGFIIGFGLGPGVASRNTTFTGVGSLDRQTKFGVATDFHIGGVVGESLELYYMNKVVFTGSDIVDLVTTGVTGVGVTYPLNPQFSINGGVGVGVWTLFEGGSTASETGFGLVGGGRYGLSDRWGLNLDITYLNPNSDSIDISVWNVAMTINILSH